MEHRAQSSVAAAWSGGGSPYAVNSKKLGMWLFIVSDTLTFGALLMAYSYLRAAHADWPTPFEISPGIVFATMMTAVLLSSSLTMVFAVAAAHAGNVAKAKLYLCLTALGGIAFVVLHMREWMHLIHEGVKPFSNPWGTPLFGATFFGITGLHMTHVAIGVAYLLIVASRFGKPGRVRAEDVEVSGLYWHFVDLVWMFVFPLVYLMSVKMH
jgi:cytochrome c oxidase subunit 3